MNSINSTSAAGGGSGGGSTERGGSASAARHHHSQIIASESGDTENLLEDMWAKADQDIKRINTRTYFDDKGILYSSGLAGL
jgi:hypothetical protein